MSPLLKQVQGQSRPRCKLASCGAKHPTNVASSDRPIDLSGVEHPPFGASSDSGCSERASIEAASELHGANALSSEAKPAHLPLFLAPAAEPLQICGPSVNAATAVFDEHTATAASSDQTANWRTAPLDQPANLPLDPEPVGIPTPSARSADLPIG